MLIKGEEGAGGAELLEIEGQEKGIGEGGGRGAGENSKWVTLRTETQLV